MIESEQETYLKEGAVFPFCKGCGHHHYVNRLDDALVKLKLDPKNVVIVSDIGCIGILDSLFDTTHTFHTTHGRSTAFATGIEIADAVLRDSKLKTIVVIGDGGSMIGLLHIINAALMNADVTVLVANNMLFGMTGGQNSNFSPLEFVTPTTPEGNIIPPIDICEMVKKCGAEFVARAAANDKNLSSLIAEAIAHPGFALVEIMELCTEYAVPKNKLDGKTLRTVMEQNHHSFGVLTDDFKRIEFGTLYREKVIGTARRDVKDDVIPVGFQASLTGTLRCVVAGTAGEKVQLASYLLMRAAIMSGLHATQKNDNPVTQGSGFSLSEICLSSDEICYTGIDEPDVVIISSIDGLNEVRSNGSLNRATERTLLIAEQTLPEFEVKGKFVRLPLRATCTPARAAVGGVVSAVLMKNPFPLDALFEAIRHHAGEKVSLYQNDSAKLNAHLPAVNAQ